MGDLVSDDLLRRLRRHLADGRACTSAELADALGVSARQVRRALEALPADGMRVVEERDGRARRYRLDGLDLPPSPRPVPLSERELRAILALVGDGAGLGPLGPAALAAVRKLVEAFGFDVYAFDPEDLVGQIVVARPRARPADPLVFDAVAEAVQARQTIRLALGSGSGWGRLEPYALALVDGGWVAVGREPLRDVLVRVPLEEVRAVGPKADFFDPPAAFDAVAALETANTLEAEELVLDRVRAARVARAPMSAGYWRMERAAPPAAAPAARAPESPPPPAGRAEERRLMRVGEAAWAGPRVVVFVPGGRPRPDGR